MGRLGRLLGRRQVMTGVPENWIPMIPVHLANDNREIQLQRAKMDYERVRLRAPFTGRVANVDPCWTSSRASKDAPARPSRA